MEPSELLQELLRVRSVNPPGDEGGVASLLEGHLSGAGLKTEILESPEGRPSLIARLEGPADRPALVLLSHSDVVAVEEEHWTHDPFGGEIDDGFIWGRGALDMKGIAVMHAHSITTLAQSDRPVLREVILVMVADEEAGGKEGARWLIEAHAEKVGFGDGRPPPEVLCEGAYGLSGVLDRPIVPIALGEKTAVWLEVVAKGDPGHGALPPLNQAPVGLVKAVKDIAGFGTPRVHPVMREQFAILAEAASGASAAALKGLASPAGPAIARVVAPRLRESGVLGLLLSDSLTPTQLSSGYKSNVVPGDARASFDCRLLPDTDVDDFVEEVDRKARRHGARVAEVKQNGRGPVSEKGDLYAALERASRGLEPGALPTMTISPGITDARFFRARGAQAYGWCPLVLTPELLGTIHGHDERVSVDDFKKAVRTTAEVVSQAAL